MSGDATFLVVAIVAIGALLLAVHAVFVAPYDLDVSEIESVIEDLPPAFDGYRIAIVADLHQWAGARPSHLRRITAIVADGRPDLIALLGDYGVSYVHLRLANRMLYEGALRRVIPAIRSMSAPDGIVAILGNHDYYADPAVVRRELQDAGVAVLVNRCASIVRDGSLLRICGTDDLDEGVIDPRVAEVDPHNASAPPTIVLAHHPDTILMLDPGDRMDIVLAGHTHGGQVVLPLYGAPITLSSVCNRRHASGWVPNPRSLLYVSRGVGAQTPVRFRCRPEIAFLTLRGAPSSGIDVATDVARQQPA